MSRDEKLRAVCAVVAVALIGAGARALQLNRAAQEWAVANPKQWAIDFPDEAAKFGGVPPPVDGPFLWVGMGAMLVIVVLAFVGAFYYWQYGNDAPKFEDHDAEEQSRRIGAGAALHHGLAGAPTVANTVATRAGRRAGRAAARDAKQSRRH